MKARASLKIDKDMNVEVKLTDSDSKSTSYKIIFKIIVPVATNSTTEGASETSGSNETEISNDTESSINDEANNGSAGSSSLSNSYKLNASD